MSEMRESSYVGLHGMTSWLSALMLVDYLLNRNTFQILFNLSLYSPIWSNVKRVHTSVILSYSLQNEKFQSTVASD